MTSQAKGIESGAGKSANFSGDKRRVHSGFRCVSRSDRAVWSGDAAQLSPPTNETTWRYHVRDKSGETWGKFHTRAKAREFAAVHRPPMKVVDTSRESSSDTGAVR